MADVFEFIIDGTSGIAAGGAEGKAIVAGLCSKGQVGKSYLLTLSSNINELLGIGELADAVTDMLTQAGQDAVLIAVPVEPLLNSKAIGAVKKSGEEAFLISVKCSGIAPKAGADLLLEITESGELNSGLYILSFDNGLSFSKPRTLPTDGIINLLDYDLQITLPQGEYKAGTTYTCTVEAPKSNMEKIFEALNMSLNTYDVEFVYICGASNPMDWVAADVKAQELWSIHKPIYFKMESRLPLPDEDVHDYATAMIKQAQSFSSHFVQVCAQYGSITNIFGKTRIANFAALHAGKTMAIPVHRAAGRVRDGALQGVRLPLGWDAVQPLLENAGYVTAKNYGGLKGSFFGDSRTMAEAHSDYKYEEVLRVVFKAVRKLRLAALLSLYDDAGDPLLPYDGAGIAYLEAQLKNALDAMTNAVPRELISYTVRIPKGQDIVNNGIAVEHTLIGVPVIRKVKLFASYVYAGSHLDPRLAPIYS